MKYFRKSSLHTEWLSMMDVSGPFLAISVLERVFPQGLEAVETPHRQRLREAYYEWRDAVDDGDPQIEELHREWTRFVLHEFLQYDDTILIVNEGGEAISYVAREHGGVFTPEFILKGSGEGKPRLFISVLPAGTDLEKVNQGDGWPSSLVDRMISLCRTQEVHLGLLTNGERWMLVNAPVGATSGHASWYSRLWFQEPVTLKAFQSLLGVRRFYGKVEETLETLLEESLQYQQEVTDTLGEQVRRAVEVLVQSLDKADQDRNRLLLRDVSAAELYEAGLTVMMRLVFVLCAEERGLLLLGDRIYDSYYAVSTLRSSLAEEAERLGPEVLERRHDAWSRLLALFRAIYGGIEQETLRMPALGGSLFDPDRFPFLEGRAKGAGWRDTAAVPLPIDNRTVLLLLDALQILEQKGGALSLSYKALDVEQIGHVYEGLLEYTVARLPRVTLGLEGSQKAKNPNLSLEDLESVLGKGENDFLDLVQEATQRSRPAIARDSKKKVDDAMFGKVVAACGGDLVLSERIRPFTHLLRQDAWGDFIVYRKDAFAVTLGSDRRETGTHYTPKSLTESIVEKALEPVVYLGPAEGKPRGEWKLKAPSELLDLKICDPAMGSGAFLVQVCRWLSERLVEAWGNAEAESKYVKADGDIRTDLGGSEPMPKPLDDRLLIARRLIAERCIYGVDINPLAVELAKLSIWLVTMAKGRPFGFLDHNLRSGDSLLGIHRLDQLTKLSMDPDSQTQVRVFGQNIKTSVIEAIEIRKKLRTILIRDIRDVDAMKSLDSEARRKLESAELIADAMIGKALRTAGDAKALEAGLNDLSIDINDYLGGKTEKGKSIVNKSRQSFSIDLPVGKQPRTPFHWPLEFPEVFDQKGFDAIIGNPPFLGGRSMRSTLGDVMINYLLICWPHSSINADLCAFFYLRAALLIRTNGELGLLATKTIGQGDTAKTGLAYLIEQSNISIHFAISPFRWPGTAAVVVAIVVAYKGEWLGQRYLNDNSVDFISPILDDQKGWGEAKSLQSNSEINFQGSVLAGLGFVLSAEEAETFLNARPSNREVILPYLGGDDVNSHPSQKASRWVIDFRDYPLELCQRKWPELLERITFLVKPQRDKSNRKAHRQYWWHHGDKRPALYNQIKDKKEVFVISRVTKYVAFIKVPSSQVFQESVIIFDLPGWSSFSTLQSSFHDLWVRRGSSTLGETLRYTPSDYFDTFPFLHLNNKDLGKIGEEYHETRKLLMETQNKGLTAIYNCFHDQEICSREIETLRGLHSKLDTIVAAAYGWNDLHLRHDFFQTKEGIRYTISPSLSGEVLQRLLKLNQALYEVEVRQRTQEAIFNKQGKKYVVDHKDQLKMF